MCLCFEASSTTATQTLLKPLQRDWPYSWSDVNGPSVCWGRLSLSVLFGPRAALLAPGVISISSDVRECALCGCWWALCQSLSITASISIQLSLSPCLSPTLAGPTTPTWVRPLFLWSSVINSMHTLRQCAGTAPVLLPSLVWTGWLAES